MRSGSLILNDVPMDDLAALIALASRCETMGFDPRGMTPEVMHPVKVKPGEVPPPDPQPRRFDHVVFSWDDRRALQTTIALLQLLEERYQLNYAARVEAGRTGDFSALPNVPEL